MRATRAVWSIPQCTDLSQTSWLVEITRSLLVQYGRAEILNIKRERTKCGLFRSQSQYRQNTHEATLWIDTFRFIGHLLPMSESTPHLKTLMSSGQQMPDGSI